MYSIEYIDILFFNYVILLIICMIHTYLNLMKWFNYIHLINIHCIKVFFQIMFFFKFDKNDYVIN